MLSRTILFLVISQIAQSFYAPTTAQSSKTNPFEALGLLQETEAGRAAGLAFAAEAFEDASGASLDALTIATAAEAITNRLAENDIAADAARVMVYTAKAKSLKSLNDSLGARAALLKINDILARQKRLKGYFAYFAWKAADAGFNSGNDDVVAKITSRCIGDALSSIELSAPQRSVLASGCGLFALRVGDARTVITALSPRVNGALSSDLATALRRDPYINDFFALLAIAYSNVGDSDSASKYYAAINTARKFESGMTPDVAYELALWTAANLPSGFSRDASDRVWRTRETLFQEAYGKASARADNEARVGEGARTAATRQLMFDLVRIRRAKVSLAIKLGRFQDAIADLKRQVAEATSIFPVLRAGSNKGWTTFLFGERDAIDALRTIVASMDGALEQLAEIRAAAPQYQETINALALQITGLASLVDEVSAAAAGSALLGETSQKEARQAIAAFRKYARKKSQLDRAMMAKLGAVPENLLRNLNALDALVQNYRASTLQAFDELQIEIRRAERPLTNALSKAITFDLAATQGRLKANEAIIVTRFGSQSGVAFTLTNKAAVLSALNANLRGVQERAAQVRGYLDGRGGVAGKDARMALDKLSENLAPAFSNLGHSITRVYWIPDRAISALPPHILLDMQTPNNRSGVIASPSQADVRGLQVQDGSALAFVDAPWMVNRFAFILATAPNMVDGPISAARNRASKLFAVADPVFSGQPDRSVTNRDILRKRALQDDIRALPQLPETRGEVQSIARELGGEGSFLFGDAATETNVKAADLLTARVLVFATHGLAPGDAPGIVEPGLVLTPPLVSSELDDGILTASEVSSLDINADLVILSACSTASDDGRSGSAAMSGLVRAFLFAGGRSVVASHWPVRSDAAAKLTVSMIRSMAGGDTSAEALQSAMIKLVQNEPDPRVWAPFVVVGKSFSGPN